MKTAKLLSIIILAILNLSIVFAANNYNFNFYDLQNAQVTGVAGLFYQCNVAGCADNVEPARFAEQNSGATNLISQDYLGTSTPQDYMAVFFKQCYRPLTGVTYGDWGTGQTYSYNVVLQKAKNCHSPIYSYNVLNSVYANEPLQINIMATLDATTSSAFKRTGFPPLFTPVGYETYFSAETRITLEIRNSFGVLVNNQVQNIDIPVDTNMPVHFEWTPTIAGNYTASITTTVTDCQCENQTDEYVQSAFTVLGARPLNQCYTIINNLTSNSDINFVNNTITLNLNKISNYANTLGVLSPVQTSLLWTMTNLNTSAAQTFTSTETANTNSLNTQIITRTWRPTTAGQYLINVQGTSNDAICAGIQNIPMSTQMTLIVNENPITCTDVDHDGYSQEGGSCGARDCADTNPNINPGNAEVCNSVDDDCDGNIDEGFGLNIFCSVGIGACQRTGVSICTANGLGIQCSAVAALPTVEICDGIDNNCNGIIDDGCAPVLVCTDVDGDGYNSTGGLCGPIDCNDNNALIRPGAIELCNGVDDNCNGIIDDGCAAPNLLPVAVAGNDITTATGQTVFLNGSASYDPDGVITNHLWQISDGRTFTGSLQSLSFPTIGVYTATLTVTDNNGSTASDSLIITVAAPQILLVTISATPTEGSAPLQVFFTSNIISGNAPYTYYWTFGDGGFSYDPNPVHVFYDEESHTVTLTLTDALGNIATALITINTKDKEVLNSREAIYISNYDVLSNDIHSGDTIAVNTGFKNIAGRRLDDAVITISIPELGVYQNAKLGRMKNGGSVQKTFYLKIPSWTGKGYHNLRLAFDADSGQVKRVEYRQIIIK